MIKLPPFPSRSGLPHDVVVWLQRIAFQVSQLVIPGYGGIRLSAPVGFPDIGAGWQTLPADAVTTSAPADVVQDPASNSVSVLRAGTWRADIALAFAFTDVNSGRSTNLRIVNLTTLSAGGSVILGVGRNAAAANYSVGLMVDIGKEEIGDQFAIQIGGGDTFTSVTINGYVFNLTLVNDDV